MLTDRYLASVKNVPQIFDQIVKGTAPQTFNLEHLISLGFASSNDRAVIPLLKTLGFLSDTGQPTERYHRYRAGGDEARKVLGEAILEAYEDLFHINANPTEQDRAGIIGKFKSTHNASDTVAERQAATFFALLKLANIESARGLKISMPISQIKAAERDEEIKDRAHNPRSSLNLRYQIEVHLPATKDIEVYHAIFLSIRENLLD